MRGPRVTCLAAILACATQLPRVAAQSPFPTPANRLLADSRRTIDNNNLTYTLTSDEPQVSIGALDVFGDGVGTALATAVLFTTPAGNGFPIAPVRCDILLYKAPGQSRDSVTDLFLTLYSDDGTAEHNPGVQLSAPLSLAAYTTPTLLTFRAVWYQIDVSNSSEAGWWPTLNASAVYWAVVSPGDPTKLGLGAANNGQPFNGVVWAGFTLAQLAASNISTPIAITTDPTGGSLFTARELRSSRFANDTTNAANTADGVNFVKNTENWGSVASSMYGSERYRNWQTAGSTKYGISVIGNQANPSTTPTSTATATSSSSASSSATATATSTSSASSAATATSSATSPATATATSSFSASSAATAMSSSTASESLSATATSSSSASESLSATATSSRSSTATRSAAPSASASSGPIVQFGVGVNSQILQTEFLKSAPEFLSALGSMAGDVAPGNIWIASMKDVATGTTTSFAAPTPAAAPVSLRALQSAPGSQGWLVNVNVMPKGTDPSLGAVISNINDGFASSPNELSPLSQKFSEKYNAVPVAESMFDLRTPPGILGAPSPSPRVVAGSSSSSSGPSSELIAGGIAGVVSVLVLLIIAAIVLVCCLTRRAKGNEGSAQQKAAAASTAPPSEGRTDSAPAVDAKAVAVSVV